MYATLRLFIMKMKLPTTQSIVLNNSRNDSRLAPSEQTSVFIQHTELLSSTVSLLTG